MAAPSQPPPPRDHPIHATPPHPPAQRVYDEDEGTVGKGGSALGEDGRGGGVGDGGMVPSSTAAQVLARL
jgi:hypothetical protein